LGSYASDEPLPVAIWLTHTDDGTCADLVPPAATKRDRPGSLLGPLSAAPRDADHEGSDPDIGPDGEPVPPESDYDEPYDDDEEPDDDDPISEDELAGAAQEAQSPGASSLSDDEIAAFRADLIACRRAQTIDTVTPFIAQLEAAMSGNPHGSVQGEIIGDDGTTNQPAEPIPGVRIAEFETLAPLVQVSLTPDEIEEISGWAEIDTIYALGVDVELLDHSRASIGADHLHNWNVEGNGQQVGVIEVNGDFSINFPSNPDANFGLITQRTTSTCNGAHADSVVGVIHSQHNDYRGIAPDAQVLLAGGCASNTNNILSLMGASDWAVTEGAEVLNLSWGVEVDQDSPAVFAPGFRDRFYDNLVYNTGTSVVVSAGNEGGIGDQVTGPGLGYNVLTVGAYNDAGSSAWGNDSMAGLSSFVGPSSLHNDRTKPEIVAPGQNIETLEFNDTGVVSGTSVAAPHVSGATALMQQRDPWLELFPEGVKAMFMASAVHNIEGAARLSDRDGAGAIVVDNADNIFRNVTGDWAGQVFTCIEGGFRVVDTIHLQQGLSTRTAVTWAVEGTYNRHFLEPSADLDMGIWDPNGVRVASSGSWENNYEIVQFTPAMTGDYDIRVYDYRCDGIDTRRVAWAWVQEYPRNVRYGVELRQQGWGGWASNGATAGNTTGTRRIERFRAEGVSTPQAMDVRYQIRQYNEGWSPVRENGQGAGVDGRKLQILKMWLFNQPTGWGIRYRLNRPTWGWTSWKHDGEAAGGTPLSSRKRGVQVQLVPAHN